MTFLYISSVLKIQNNDWREHFNLVATYHPYEISLSILVSLWLLWLQISDTYIGENIKYAQVMSDNSKY